MEDKENKNNVVKTSKVDHYNDDDEDHCYEIDPISFTRKLTFEDSDDVAVIADKGPVALRDFPHPRHLCANYPFNTTPHESHCNQCFCYICEVAAPCVQWKMATAMSTRSHGKREKSLEVLFFWISCYIPFIPV